MNTTVSLEMAKALREAGFIAPEISSGQLWAFKASGRISEQYLEFSKDHVRALLIYLANALEIIEQMPGSTIGKLSTGEWACSFPIANNYIDFRTDPCPHTAASKAFLAWKKGLK